jgi:hypothetical protein
VQILTDISYILLAILFGYILGFFAFSRKEDPKETQNPEFDSFGEWLPSSEQEFIRCNLNSIMVAHDRTLNVWFMPIHIGAGYSLQKVGNEEALIMVFAPKISVERSASCTYYLKTDLHDRIYPSPST